MSDTGPLIADGIAALLGAIFAAPFAWFIVDWPTPLPLVPRVLGWLFFLTLGAIGSLSIRRTS